MWLGVEIEIEWLDRQGATHGVVDAGFFHRRLFAAAASRSRSAKLATRSLVVDVVAAAPVRKLGWEWIGIETAAGRGARRAQDGNACSLEWWLASPTTEEVESPKRL